MTIRGWMWALWLVTLAANSVAVGDEAGGGDSGGEPSGGGWVTGLVEFEDRIFASTADGLLLRPATVRSMPTDLSDPGEDLFEMPAAVWDLAVSPSARCLAAVDYRGNLAVHRFDGGETKLFDGAARRWSQTIIASGDGECFLIGNEAGEVLRWSIEKAEVVAEAKLGEVIVTSLALHGDGHVVASTSDGKVHRLSYPELKTQAAATVGEGSAWSVAVLGEDVYVGSNDGGIYRVDRDFGSAQRLVRGKDWITTLVAGGGVLLAGEPAGRVHRLTLGRTETTETPSGVWAILNSTDGRVLVGTRRHGARGIEWTGEVEEEPDEREDAEGMTEASEGSAGDEPEQAASEEKTDSPDGNDSPDSADQDEPTSEASGDSDADPAADGDPAGNDEGADGDAKASPEQPAATR